MGIFHSPRLSTAGLLSYIDTFNPKCYISGSTNMYDLVDGESYSVGTVAYESSSLKFNGVDQQIAYKDFRNVGENRTVEMYHKPLIKGGSNGPIGQGGQFRFYTTDDTTLGSFWFSTELSSGDSINFSGEWANMLNRWNYTAMTLQSGSVGRLYSNDSYVEDSIAFGLESSTQTVSYLGNIFSGASYWYNGYISVVRVYNRSLTPTEISFNKLALDSKFRNFNL